MIYTFILFIFVYWILWNIIIYISSFTLTKDCKRIPYYLIVFCQVPLIVLSCSNNRLAFYRETSFCYYSDSLNGRALALYANVTNLNSDLDSFFTQLEIRISLCCFPRFFNKTPIRMTSFLHLSYAQSCIRISTMVLLCIENFQIRGTRQVSALS